VPCALLAAAAGAILCIITILQYKFTMAPVPMESTHIMDIGNSLISTGKYGYALPFEVISILLLAAMIGSIVIAKKRKD